MARMAAANGIEDRAFTPALDGPGLQQGYVLTEVARAYGHLDETGYVFAFAEKALSSVRMRRMGALWRPSGLSRLWRVWIRDGESRSGARRADARLARRRERRKKDAKGRGKGGLARLVNQGTQSSPRPLLFRLFQMAEVVRGRLYYEPFSFGFRHSFAAPYRCSASGSPFRLRQGNIL